VTADECLARALRGDLAWIDAGGWDADELLAAADDHGVTALVWDALGSRPGPAGALRATLDARVRADAARDLIVQAEMRRVLDAIAASGERAVVFKGSALAYTAYTRPWHRPRTDTDLLAAHAAVEGIGRVLGSCGYERSDALSTGELVSHQVAFERTDPLGVRHIVDLHWKIVNPQVLADVISFEEAWAASGAAPALGGAARVPSPVASVVLACVHRLAHHQGHDRLVWLQDLALLVSAFGPAEWTALCDLACERGVAAICADGLGRAHEVLGAPLPADALARLDAAGRVESTRAYVDGEVRRRDVLLSDLAALAGWRARMRLLREHAFPPAAFVLQRYGRHSRWWLPLLYAHRLVTGAFRWARP
jgi:hypothetical protein